MKKTSIYLLFLFLHYSYFLSAQEYLGQPLPGPTPEIFAPGIISTAGQERDITISPDGSEIYYTVARGASDGNIYFVKLENGVWNLPEIAPFSGNNKDLEPAFAPDGNRLFFISKRTGNFDIWYVEREPGGEWSEVKNVGSPVNTPGNEFYPSVTNDGSLYYTARYSNGLGGEDIWYSKFLNGSYQPPVPVASVSSAADEYNAFVDPNEQYIYFGSFGRSDDIGDGDLYISRKQNGAWGSPEHLGNTINSGRIDFCPYVSVDGLYLFFTSQRGDAQFSQTTNPFDLAGITKALLSPRTAGSDIYWKKR